MPVAVVTGSSSGIGRATALELANRGCDLVLHGHRNLQGLYATAREIQAASKSPEVDRIQVGPRSTEPRVLVVTGDITCLHSCRNFVQAAFAWQGRIDVWVNNAGADVLTGRPGHASFDQKLQSLLAVDVVGTIRLSRMVTERMLQQAVDADLKPCLINLGWDQAQSGMEGAPGQLFCTTKAAVEAFTRALALSVGPAIRVNAVAPGWIKTEWGQHQSGYWDRRAKGESILNRWGQPEDVATAIAWLVSREAEFVNGQILQVNGGFRKTTSF